MNVFRTYAAWIFRLRWVIIPVWIAVIAVAIALLPSLPTVVARQKTSFLPDSSSVIQAAKLADQVNPEKAAKSTAVVAIQDQNGLTAEEQKYFEDQLRRIEQDKAHYDVQSVQQKGNTDASLADKFVSKDHTTEIALIGFQDAIGDPGLPDALAKVQAAFAHPPQGAQVYLTGDAPIQEDDIAISQRGAERTTVVTIVLVLVILLVVFRSLLAPLLTLLAIGLSFALSSSVVAGLTELGLPVSTFTQTFLIATLFGAGTDYSIILLNRFREELSLADGDRLEALQATLQGVGKTVIFSSLTVIVSFAALGLANFGLYKSAVGVAIGVAITLLTCLVFIPALMSWLGAALYWPRKPHPGAAHGESRLWGWTSRLSTAHPWRVILVLMVALAPIASLFSEERTFDPMADIPQAPAVKGFQAVADAFGPGEALPTTIVLQTDKNLRTPQGLATIQNVTATLANVPLVKEVDSATQPVGKPVKAFQIANQNQQAAGGLGDVANGLSKLADNLKQSGNRIGQKLADLNQLAAGSQQLTNGIGQVSSGVQSLSDNAQKLAQGAHPLAQGIAAAAQGATQLHQGTQSLAQSEGQLAALSSNLKQGLEAWAKAHPEVAQDPAWQQLLAMAAAEQSGTAQAATAAEQLASGSGQLAASLGQLKAGGSQLDAGLSQLAQGASKLAQGAAQLPTGSQQVANGVKQLPPSLHQLASGLKSAGDGAAKLQDGVTQVQNFLRNTKSASSAGSPGFYVPKSAVESNRDLAAAMDAYISPDGHIAKFTVILNRNPYSTEAMAAIPQLVAAADAALLTSPIHDGKVLAGGTTPVQAELNRVSGEDFSRSMGIILVAIFVLLAVMLRSLIAPVYIILSLAATYFVTMGLVQTIVLHVLHKQGLSWAVPFFVFLLLVALGVDYSIFLMTRFEEEYLGGMSPREAIRTAMVRMGNVIFSAAAIMAGTFGSMVVAGVESLIEIGLAVVIGLILYTAVLLAFFIPACVRVVGRGHGWPFAVDDAEEDSREPRRWREAPTGP
jgi:RND superfamily putative drug exporter